MTRYHEPGRDGKWNDLKPSTTLHEALERIAVLEAALSFYSDVNSYNAESVSNEVPAYGELMNDAGLRARVGRLAADVDEYVDWLSALYVQGIRY